MECLTLMMPNKGAHYPVRVRWGQKSSFADRSPVQNRDKTDWFQCSKRRDWSTNGYWIQWTRSGAFGATDFPFVKTEKFWLFVLRSMACDCPQIATPLLDVMGKSSQPKEYSRRRWNMRNLRQQYHIQVFVLKRLDSIKWLLVLFNPSPT